jgi:ATP-binding protein involved in chromosome partitioning
MMGVNSRPKVEGKKLLPIESYGVRLMSLGFLVEEETPVIWRGPLVAGIVKQFLEDVRWGELDYLIVDLPPGTGDAQLSLVQLVPVTGVVVVTTPQDVALHDAIKALRMFEKVGVPVLGIVENMSYFLCPHCGQRSEIFSHGGAREAAGRLEVPFLGEVPLDGAIRAGGDAGQPPAAVEDHPAAAAFARLAGAVASRVSVVNLSGR